MSNVHPPSQRGSGRLDGRRGDEQSGALAGPAAEAIRDRIRARDASERATNMILSSRPPESRCRCRSRRPTRSKGM